MLRNDLILKMNIIHLVECVLKAKLAYHLARCLILPVEILERCGLATGPVTVKLLPYVLSIRSSATGICATGLYFIAYFTRQHNR